ncbi:MAG TPA: tetratricopeptide repeat protein, partial [Acidobacteriaceae bacterium]|nr:tetratricopeptide repeat protein [Acidobacteriaceae bacterium]
SQSSAGPDGGENEAPNQVADPVRAKKDAGVGDYYLKSHDYEGALLRYKDATMADPTNVEAIFGLAESQRMLKKNADAARNYQLYLEIVPNGPKAKQALKALKTLGSGG